MTVSRQRRRMLAASLMPAAIIGIPLALLLISEMRSLGRLEQATQQVLTQTAVRVAEELAREIRRDLPTTYGSLLDTIPPAMLQAGDFEGIQRALDTADSASGAVAGTFLVGLADPGIPMRAAEGGALVLFDRAHSAGQTSPAAANPGAAPWVRLATRAGFQLQAALGRAVLLREREVEARDLPAGCGFLDVDGSRYLLLLRLPFPDPAPGDRERFMGYVVSTTDLTARYFPALAARIRGPGWTFSTDQPLEVSIVDDRGNEVYRTGPSLRTGYVHETPFPLLLLGDDHLVTAGRDHPKVPVWTVRSGYPGTNPAALARSSTNQQRQVLFLVSLVATVGIVLSGRAVARELGLAGLKAEFVSSVSHDLKTPVASIQVLADVLKTAASMPPEKVKRYGKVIGGEARKLGKLVDGILEFERINTGGRMYIVESIDLRAPVRDAVGEFAAQLKEGGFTTQLRLPASGVAFVGNAEALGHAFSNVIGNAIKYSAEELFLRVELRIVDGNAVIDVHDRGVGVHAGERAKIFERFYRVRRDTETDPAGTGLGLPIARHVVRAHGGRISVTGRPGGGSVFTIELPLARSDPADPEGNA